MNDMRQAFEELGFWESETEEEKIVIYGMDFDSEDLFIVFTDEAGKTPLYTKDILVAACYNNDDCFLWGKELANFEALKELCQKHGAGSKALAQAIETYELPKK